MELWDLERNVLGGGLRSEVETGLVLGLVAVQEPFPTADANMIGEGLLELLKLLDEFL